SKCSLPATAISKRMNRTGISRATTRAHSCPTECGALTAQASNNPLGRIGAGKRALVIAIFTALTAVVLGLLAEGAVRVRQWVNHGTSTVLGYTFDIDPASGLRVPRADQSTKKIRINSLGFRSPELQTPKPARTVRLAFLGASTTYCAEASSNEAT